MKSINALQRCVRYQANRPAVTALAWEMPDRVPLPALSLLHRCIDSDIERFAYDHARGLYFLSTRPSGRIVSLDHFVEEQEIPPIDLLKIEAEGSEPEVIRGAWSRCLRMTAAGALDASPERNGRSPAAECLALLGDAGFSVVGANAAKGRFLLRHSSRGFPG